MLFSGKEAAVRGILALITGVWLFFLPYSAAVYCKVLCAALLVFWGMKILRRYPHKILLILSIVLAIVFLFCLTAPAYAVWLCCLLQLAVLCVNIGVCWYKQRRAVRFLSLISAVAALAVLLSGICHFDLFAQRGPLILMLFACAFCCWDIRK